MKFRVTFKTPDAVDDGIGLAVSCIDEEFERDDVTQELKDFSERWVSCGECITIEFDTEAGTATVVNR